MKNKTVFFLLLLSHFFAYGQNEEIIRCDIHVEIIPKESDTTVFCLYSDMCKITQTFYFQDYKKDSIFLELKTPSSFPFLNFIYFQKINVLKHFDNTTENIDFQFNYEELKFFLPEKNCKVEITYFYHSDYFYYSNSKFICTFMPYQSTWMSWFFTNSEMKIMNVSFTIPEHIYLFADMPQEKKEDKTILLFDSIPDNKITFFCIKKRYYEYFQEEIQSHIVKFYLFEDIIETEDSTSLDTYYLPSQRVNNTLKENYLSFLQHDLKNISTIFNKTVNIDILEACLDIHSEEDTIRWGSGFLLSDNHLLVIMDTSFWSEHHYLHEIVHLFTNILPEKRDSSYNFFNESMTEFLTIYFKYDNIETIDSIFNNKILKYETLDNVCNSIFSVIKNELQFDLGGTYGIVYLKTPFIIHSFAKRIGIDKFIQILSKFYQQIEQTKIVNFKILEETFKSEKVSNEDWQWFERNL